MIATVAGNYTLSRSVPLASGKLKVKKKIYKKTNSNPNLTDNGLTIAVPR